MAPEQDRPPNPRYMTKAEFDRRRTANILKKAPPPVRNPDLIQLPSAQESAEVEVDAHDSHGKPQKIVVRVNLPSRRPHRDYRRHESDEGGLMAAAIISFFVPLGFFLALWPAFSARGPAKTVAIVCIMLHVAMIFLFIAMSQAS